ncbi:hypothetical protein QE152_g22421 [Popillia japonica]|uniref:Uncharacterized protein n=1 Tax=Popillia japonica TaxID=7064 RepID=A0AAW1KIP9_POPJA
MPYRRVCAIVIRLLENRWRKMKSYAGRGAIVQFPGSRWRCQLTSHHILNTLFVRHINCHNYPNSNINIKKGGYINLEHVADKQNIH